MSKNKFMNSRGRRFSFQGLSIQQRLPLLICVLLLSTMITFSWISYIGVKNAALKTAKERLLSLTGQLSSLFSQSAQVTLALTNAAAGQESIKKYLRGDTEFRMEVTEDLKKLRLDSTWVLVELLDMNRQPLLRSGRDSIESRVNFDSLLTATRHSDSLTGVGKIYLLKDSMYYPITVAVYDNKQVIGYLVRWKLLATTPKTLEQFSQLLGTKAKLYIGNNDGTLWTDMIKSVSYEQLDTAQIQQPFEYSDQAGKQVIASAKPISNTAWLVSVEFPRQLVLDSANNFLRWIIIIGSILVAIGIFLAWLMSRNITHPLNKLTEAALILAGGDYSSPVKIDRKDELGKLAMAFNSMAVQVRNAQQNLEKKVTERTIQLETLNKELEAFTYSISHDLRAPLRGIIGFTAILEEEYASKLDDEAKRITSIIKKNTLKMGRLIDGLLTFSRMERQDIAKMEIHTNEMVKEVIDSLQQQNTGQHIDWVLHNMPDIKGDINMIQQVWVNLISNAIKYSAKKEHPRIEIGSFIQNGQTAFFIKDNGVGFDEKYRDKLFKVFQRLHSVDEFEGTGIGLALVEKIISKHGGKVWAAGETDKGAGFYFSVPDENNINSDKPNIL
jgi:signal transduction histidine kinase